MAKEEPRIETRALDRGLQLLSTLAETPEGLSAPDLAEHNELNRATVYRLLSTLGARGYVVQDPESRRYSLGPGRDVVVSGQGLESRSRRARQAVDAAGRRRHG